MRVLFSQHLRKQAPSYQKQIVWRGFAAVGCAAVLLVAPGTLTAFGAEKYKSLEACENAAKSIRGCKKGNNCKAVNTTRGTEYIIFEDCESIEMETKED